MGLFSGKKRKLLFHNSPNFVVAAPMIDTFIFYVSASNTARSQYTFYCSFDLLLYFCF